MLTNTLPYYDTSDNPTECCPRFKPEGWNEQQLHFDAKPFVRVETRSLFHIPVNMGSVFSETFEQLLQEHAIDEHQSIILSRDLSAWKSEHLFAITSSLAITDPNQELVHLSGDFYTKVFEGPYKNAPQWYEQLKDQVKSLGKQPKEIYFFYTTCPKCAQYYGKNYVVGFAHMN
jgi:hypothetical protein